MGAGSTCPTWYGFCWFMWLYEGKLGDLVDSMHARSSLTYDKRKDSLLQFNNILRLSEDLEKSLFTGPKKISLLTYYLRPSFSDWRLSTWERSSSNSFFLFILNLYALSRFYRSLYICCFIILRKPYIFFDGYHKILLTSFPF